MTPDVNLIAAAIAHMEGFYSVKSLAHRNSNPGNIEHPDGGFVVYPDPSVGWAALVADITANGGKTLRSFITRYAPPSENDTATYIQTVAAICGCSPDVLLQF